MFDDWDMTVMSSYNLAEGNFIFQHMYPNAGYSQTDLLSDYCNTGWDL